MDHAAEGLGEAVGPDQADPPAGRLRDQVGRDGPAAQQHPAEPGRLVAGGQQPPQHGRDQRDQGGLAGGGRPTAAGSKRSWTSTGRPVCQARATTASPATRCRGRQHSQRSPGPAASAARGGQGRPADGVGAQLDHLGGAAGARGGQHRGQARLGRLAPGQPPAPLAVEQVGRPGGGQGALELGRRGAGVERQDRLPRLPGGHHRPGGGRPGQGDGDQGHGLRHGQVG